MCVCVCACPRQAALDPLERKVAEQSNWIRKIMWNVRTLLFAGSDKGQAGLRPRGSGPWGHGPHGCRATTGGASESVYVFVFVCECVCVRMCLCACGRSGYALGCGGCPLGVCFICRVGPEPYTYTVYDRIFSDFPVKHTVYTVFIWSWPTLFIWLRSNLRSDTRVQSDLAKAVGHWKSKHSLNICLCVFLFHLSLNCVNEMKITRRKLVPHQTKQTAACKCGTKRLDILNVCNVLDSLKCM